MAYVPDYAAIYDALQKNYLDKLRASLLLNAQWTVYSTDRWVPVPAPILRVDGKLQLEPRAEYIVSRKGTLTGISLKVFGMTGTKYSRLLRSENVSYSTSKDEQLRILRAMCDIVAVQEQADYKLVKALKALPAHKEYLRPKKGKYG